MNDAVERVLVSEEQLIKRTAELGAMITRDFQGEDLLLVSVLKGGAVFAMDLMRKIDLQLKIDFIAVSSYGSSTKSSGIVKIVKDLDYDIHGKSILIVEDIVDSGLTLSYLKELFLTRGAKDVKIAAILSKPSRRKADIKVDYMGFEIPDEFVIGYGLDYANKYRSLPYVGVLKRSIYENE